MAPAVGARRHEGGGSPTFLGANGVEVAWKFVSSRGEEEDLVGVGNEQGSYPALHPPVKAPWRRFLPLSSLTSCFQTGT